MENNKQHRAFQVGRLDLYDSFEHNQSFPSTGKTKCKNKLQSTIRGFSKFTGDQLSSCSYTADNLRSDEGRELENSFSSIPDSSRSRDSSRPNSRLSLGSSWVSNNMSNEKSYFCSKTSNKAVLTFDAESSEILTANKQACCLFGYTSSSILNVKSTELIKKPSSGYTTKEASMHAVNEKCGDIVVISGKVMEAISKTGNEFAVSVWIRKFEGHSERPCYIAAVEPVVRIVGNFTFNSQGIIISCDENFSHIHGHLTTTPLEGININKLMPSYILPPTGARINKSMRKQRTTSASLDGQVFPISVYIHSQKRDGNSDVLYEASIWFFMNISGPLTISSTGRIKSINNNFSLALLGYHGDELVDKNISDFLPELIDEAKKPRLCISPQDGDITPLLRINSNDIKEDCSPTLIEKFSENDSSPGFETFEVVSAMEHSPNSFINISHPGHLTQTNVLTPPNSPCNPTIDRINSLLLGKTSPFSKSENSETNASKRSSLIGQRSIEDSWIEITMNEGSSKGQTTATNKDLNEKEKMDKINKLLNGSLDLLKSYNDPKDSLNGSPDSAVLSASDAIECPIQRDIICRSPYSDYQSGDGSPSVENIGESHENEMKPLPRHLNNICKSGNITSTPLDQGRTRSRILTRLNIAEGHHEGHARHKNGSLIGVRYEVRYSEECDIYCIWLSMDLNNHGLNSSQCSTLFSSFNSTLPSLNASAVSSVLDYSLGAAIKQAAQRNNDSISTVVLPQEGTDEWNAIQGKFGECYDITKTIGNGAFGFVRIVMHKKTSKKFVVKFIRKEKVLEECWVNDYETDSMIPLEIALLTKFDHANIVKVLEFYENEYFFTMVMPRCMAREIDLFEFIDREPKLDEMLASYIFRQIVAAVHYIHNEGVLHRDIKDENVIIDESFTCKLIDFGSAAFYKRGKTFGTFCGTIEYCSPEVLLGHRYEGPAVEIWALGVTLYTLVYGENPFHDIEDTIEAIMKPPHILSQELMSLLQALLQPVPEHRCTMNDLVEDEWINFPVDITKYSWEKVLPSSENDISSIDNMNESGKPASRGAGEDNSMSSDENLVAQLKSWLVNQPDVPPRKMKSPDNHLMPLTRRLENINLNHSI